jgi:unsaturated rhamnogalacturonyl hydrolase
MESRRQRHLRRLTVVLLAVVGAGLALVRYVPSGLSLAGALPQRAILARPVSDHELRALIDAVARTWMSAHPAAELAWDWTDGVLVVGLERAQRQTDDPRLAAYLNTYLEAHLAHGIAVTWSDDALPALAAAERVLTGSTQFRPLVDRVVEYSMHAPRTRSGMLVHLGRVRLPLIRSWLPECWVDSLFHVVPTLVRYSHLTHDDHYRDEAARQLRLFAGALLDPATGLSTHAYNDRTPPERVPAFGARAFWARGNGWMLAALVEALAELPVAHPDRPLLLAAAQRLAQALARVQAQSGLFHTLLLRPDSYLETAGSALIVAALAKGLRLGLLPESTRAAVERGARGLVASVRRTRDHAEITGTSLGTNPIQALYGWTPTADQIDYGVGAWLMAASEIVALRQAE